MSHKILISGIGLSSFGVGRFLKHLCKLNEDALFVVKWKRIEAIKKHKSSKKYLKLFISLLLQFFDLINFYLKCFLIKKKEIIIIHPQTIGWKFVFFLMKRNKVHWYLIDNSFFCIKSYNYRTNAGECFDCLGNNSNCSYECEPFPVKVSKKQNLDVLDNIYSIRNDIYFYCQNPSQEILLKLHFGNDVQSKVVGMNTGEVDSFDKSQLKDNDFENFTLVYHGSILEPKGICYFVKLSHYLPDATFYIPASKVEVQNCIGNTCNNDNIKFVECNWETGLKELVEDSFITICPSLWSSCVEGAVLKSLKYANNVAMVDTQFGFVNDLPNDIYLRLNKNPELAALELTSGFLSRVSKKNKALVWLHNYMIMTDSNLKYLLNK